MSTYHLDALGFYYFDAHGKTPWNSYSSVWKMLGIGEDVMRQIHGMGMVGRRLLVLEKTPHEEGTAVLIGCFCRLSVTRMGSECAVDRCRNNQTCPFQVEAISSTPLLQIKKLLQYRNKQPVAFRGIWILGPRSCYDITHQQARPQPDGFQSKNIMTFLCELIANPLPTVNLKSAFRYSRCDREY